MGNMYTKFDDPNFICIVLLSWLPIEVWPWHWETTDIFLPPWGTCVPGLIILIGTLYILLPSRCWYMNRHIHCTKLSYNLSLIIEYVYQAYCFVPTEFYSCKFDFEKTIGCLFPLIIRNIVYLMVEDSNYTSNVFIWHTHNLSYRVVYPYHAQKSTTPYERLTNKLRCQQIDRQTYSARSYLHFQRFCLSYLDKL